jgi:hypothetical protein
MMELVARRSFFDHYDEQVEQLPPSLRRYRLRFSCPCCGYPTLRVRGGFGICYLCWWEDDGQDDDDDADSVRGGPNHEFSLIRARENFATYGVMYEPGNDRRVGGGDTPEEKAIKKQVIAAFDEMMLIEPEDHERLWAIVIAGDRQLRQILEDRP